MALLHVYVVFILSVVVGTHACDEGNNCGCIVSDDTTEVDEASYVCEPIYTADFQLFLERMHDALASHWLAYSFIYSFPDDNEPPEETGSPLCPTKEKHILGYFKNYGLTLCLVVKPHIQDVKKAECCSEGPACGENTRCAPSGFVQRKYLVYCDALYKDENGCLIGEDILYQTTPDIFDESDFNGNDGLRKRDAETQGNSTERAKREVGFCNPEYDHSYFAFRHDFLPSTCSARRCNCG